MRYIDIHGHVNFPEYDSDREEVICRAQKAGVAMITVGTGIETSKSAVKLAEIHENMWAIVGIHPTHVNSPLSETTALLRSSLHSSSGDCSLLRGELAELATLAQHPKVVAIGECGLDYFRSKPEEIPQQREIFEKHIELANKVGKPLMLHIRNGKSTPNLDVSENGVPNPNAYQEAIQILKKSAKVPASFHFFAGTVQDSKDIIEMGNTMSFTGVLTFARDYDEIIKTVPLMSIMSETDCPFVAPVPYRGKRNEPTYVVEVVKKIAEIRGEDVEMVSKQLLENAKRVFALK